MSVKKSSKQKNTRHHLNTAPVIAKKQNTKAKLRNQDLRSQLDKMTGLAGAVSLFAATPKKSKVVQKKSEEEKKVQTEKLVEEDIMGLISMKLSSAKAH